MGTRFTATPTATVARADAGDRSASATVDGHALDRRPPPARAPRPETDYAQLSHSIQALGLLDRRYGYYVVKAALLLAALGALWVGFAFIGDSWIQVAIAAGLGLVLTHVAFLSHDAAHRQIFKSGPANEWLTTCLGGLVMGMSASWWQSKHNRHHAHPNQIGKDPDIEPSVIIFYPQPDRRRNRLVAFLVAHQGWLFFPILTVEGLNLHAQSLVTLLGRGPVKRRRLELTFMALRWAAYLAVLFTLLSPGIAGAFLGVQLVVFGVYMGCTFAPTHKGMPILPEDARVDFLRRQVLTSRNIVGPEILTFAMGGLNRQIEHHLFPSMPRPNLRKAMAVIQPFCHQRDIAYTESSLGAAYGTVVRYLNRVGMRRSDPFECPMVSQWRPRG